MSLIPLLAAGTSSCPLPTLEDRPSINTCSASTRDGAYGAWLAGRCSCSSQGPPHAASGSPSCWTISCPLRGKQQAVPEPLGRAPEPAAQSAIVSSPKPGSVLTGKQAGGAALCGLVVQVHMGCREQLSGVCSGCLLWDICEKPCVWRRVDFLRRQRGNSEYE